MSGGSHGYLYGKEASELFSEYGIDLLEGMAMSLIKHDADDIAGELLFYRDLIKQVLETVEKMQEKMLDVFKAVEWRDSSDIGENELQEVIEKYRRKE